MLDVDAGERAARAAVLVAPALLDDREAARGPHKRGRGAAQAVVPRGERADLAARQEAAADATGLVAAAHDDDELGVRGEVRAALLELLAGRARLRGAGDLRGDSEEEG